VPEALSTALERHTDEVDVWAALQEDLDITTFKPHLAGDVEVRIFRLRWGNDYAMIANPRRLLHFELEPWEAELTQLMDGTRSVGELVVARLDGTGDLDPSAVTALVLFMYREGLLDPQPLDVHALVTEAIRPKPSLTDRFLRFMKTLRLDWPGADGHVRWWYRTVLRFLFTPASAAITAVIGTAGLVAFLAVVASHRYQVDQARAPADTLILLGLSFVSTYAHELGHATTLIHFRRRIPSAGFMLYFGSPAFFVDTSDGLMLSGHQRILEAMMGPYFELVLSGFGSFLLVAFPSAGFAPLVYKFCALNYFLILENLIPLLELDGYFVLAEAIQVPDLRERSLQFFQHDLWHKLRVREHFTKQEMGLGLYAVIGVAFTIFSVWIAIFFWRAIFGGLVTGLWNAGTGGRVLLLLLALFVTGPAIRGLLTLARTTGKRLRALWRVIRFKLETSWRVEAAEMIDALPAFDELPEEVLSDLAGRVRLISHRPGVAIFRQGDRADAFYVVRRGSLRVEEEHPDTGETLVLRTLSRGDSFGELALLNSSPRAATVRSETQTELFAVDEPTFDRLLADAIDVPSFKLTLQTMAELRDIPAFSTLGTEQLAELLEHGRWMTAAPGAKLVEQGAPGDAFYAIRSGQAEVVRDGERIGQLGPGSHFGEIALLRAVPRTASVIARTPVRAFRLDRVGFDHVVREAFARGALKSPADQTWQH